MKIKNTIERRDPYAPVLNLGTALAAVQKQKKSGWLEIRERNKTHSIQMSGGAIADVISDTGLKATDIHEQAAHMFTLVRPHVIWVPDSGCASKIPVADPARILISGVINRQDLFDPQVLVQRIPVKTLYIDPSLFPALRRLPLSRQELEFLYQLQIPAPIPMVLWKRGLNPRYAGALILALNLLGLWEDKWKAGLLPRLTTTVKILNKMARNVSDYQLLGISETASPYEIDRAFRQLSLEVHPDKLQNFSEHEKIMAQKAFNSIGAAYHRVKRSRRVAPVSRRGKAVIGKVNLVKKEAKKVPDTWAQLLSSAHAAMQSGNIRLAKSYALKALALSPPEYKRREITNIIISAA
jgi:hypothetical protein